MAKPTWHPPQSLPERFAFSAAEVREGFSTDGAFRESEFLEFKSGTGSKPIREAIVAFSNSHGGTVLVGVDDRGNFKGRRAGAGQTAVEALHEAAQSVRDPGRYSVREIDVDGSTLAVLQVARRVEGFSQTPDGRVLVRAGARNTALMGAELARFVAGRVRQRFETTETGALLDQVDRAVLGRINGAYGWSKDMQDRLSEAGLASPGTGRLTVAGVLHLHPRPHEVLGKAQVEVFRYRSATSEYDRRVLVEGPLVVQIEEAARLISEELGTDLVVQGLRRYELPRLPAVVLREALANAVAHRSYEADGTAVRVDLRPDRVDIISPGGFVEPVTVENLRDQQASRNPDVIRVLRHLGLAEDAGRGVDVMLDSMQAELMEPPVFTDLHTAVRVSLPTQSAVTPEERAWVQRLREQGEIAPADHLLLVHAARGLELTNARARELLGGADSVVARQALQRLREVGLIEQFGQRGGTTYRIGAQALPPRGLRPALEQVRDQVVELASARPVTNADVRAATGLDRNQALAVLDSLVAAGRLERRGSRRTTHYVPAEPAPGAPC